MTGNDTSKKRKNGNVHRVRNPVDNWGQARRMKQAEVEDQVEEERREYRVMVAKRLMRKIAMVSFITGWAIGTITTLILWMWFA